MKKTFVFSFKRSVPMLVGFFPIGVAYGILMQNIGYNALWTGLSSVIVLSGSLQYLMVSFLGAGAPLVTVAALSLLLSSRHMFYGLSFIEKFREFHKPSKWFLIYSLADENYSLHCAFKPEPGVNEEAAFVMSAGLVALYWLCFTMLGALLGELIRFNTAGIDFAMTALFIVILVEQIKGSVSRLPLYTALVSCAVSIAVFGAESFILPSLLLTLAALCLLRPYAEKKEAVQ